jgi:hypothetical protein
MLAKGSSYTGEAGSSNNTPWEIYYDTETGTIDIQFQSWGGRTTTYSASFTWSEDTWYQVALVADYNISGGVRSVDYTLYISDVTTATATVVLSGTYTDEGNTAAGLGSGSYLYVGAGTKGYYDAAVAGYWGGNINDVSYWDETLLSPANLETMMQSHIPEASSFGIMAGLLGLGLVLLRRRK